MLEKLAGYFPVDAPRANKEKIRSDVKHYVWDNPYLWKFYSDQVIRRCIPDEEIPSILQFCHASTRKDWSQSLDDALWAHRTAFKTLLRMSPYRVVYRKACHLPVEVKRKAYWAVKTCNIHYDSVGEQRKLQLQELKELRLETYENSRIYKEKTKRYHDKMISRKEFYFSQKVHLFNSRLKLILGKLKSRWFATKVFAHGSVEIQSDSTSKRFTVNGHRLNPFLQNSTTLKEVEEIDLHSSS
ncbi:uncharacterized protein LOC113866830 [Abrus precatorius]|uniref:Uncharacterized protein LOC113866830 n=1 Tax=Abrus precatorius TaxID=3816 RepID=A0A8B8LME6_ABRPR|nr:uncharacterized protein LOC113866830 [Abrus precatorius]